MLWLSSAKTEVKVGVSDKRVKARDHVSLTCMVGVDPHLEAAVTWFRDDVEVDFKDENYNLARSGKSPEVVTGPMVIMDLS